MGTTTFFLRHNDLGEPLNKMGKGELEKLNNLSPYVETPYYAGWRILWRKGGIFLDILSEKVYSFSDR